MAMYLGLDVSDKSTHLCAVDEAGRIRWRGICATDPETIARTIDRHCGDVSRVVLETGALSSFLYHGLVERGLPVVCICARHAKGVLSARVNKSDPHDAEGLAQLARTGWFRAVHMKDGATHLDRACLKVREQLVRAHSAMKNQLRGLLKLFGLRLGSATTPGKRAERLEVLLAQRPELEAPLAPLVASLAGLEVQIAAATRELKRRTAADPVCTLDDGAWCRSGQRDDVQGQCRGSEPLRPRDGCRRLRRARPQALPVRRTRHQGTHLQGRRSLQCAYDRCACPPANGNAQKDSYIRGKRLGCIR
nr:transposase [Sphingosinicella terrae]